MGSPGGDAIGARVYRPDGRHSRPRPYALRAIVTEKAEAPPVTVKTAPAAGHGKPRPGRVRRPRHGIDLPAIPEALTGQDRKRALKLLKAIEARTSARDAAIAAGKAIYVGRPCRLGHDGRRYTGSQACVDCAKLQKAAIPTGEAAPAGAPTRVRSVIRNKGGGLYFGQR